MLNIKKNPYILFNNLYQNHLNWCKSNKTYNLHGNEVILATSFNNKPSTRVVLLKDFNEKDGFIWFTNYRSRKGKELEVNPYAALLFYWFENIGIQIRIEGKVEKLDYEDNKKYFATRPYQSRVISSMSLQSKKLENQKEFENLIKQSLEKYDQDNKFSPICPEYWGGYKLNPVYFEFWEEGKYRLHKRFAFNKQDKSWLIDSLYP